MDVPVDVQLDGSLKGNIGERFDGATAETDGACLISEGAYRDIA